jgi:hypothetical protein
MDRVIDGVAHEVIAEQSEGGYEWSNVAVVRRFADGQLFLVTESGCSCNEPWDSPDLEPVATWQAAVDKLKVERPYNFSDDDVAAFAQQLMEAARG